MILLTRAPLCLWIFHDRLGGGGQPPPPRSRLLWVGSRSGKKRSIARQNSWRKYIAHFLPQVKTEVTRGHQRSNSGDGFLLLTFDLTKIQRCAWHHRVSLVETVRMVYLVTSKGQLLTLTSGQGQVRSRSRSGRSYCISSDSSRREKHIGVIFKFLAPFSDELLTKNFSWPLMTSSWPEEVNDKNLHLGFH